MRPALQSGKGRKPRMGYSARAVVPAKSSPRGAVPKSHSVFWKGERLEYQAACSCGWKIVGRYAVIRAATRNHLETAVPLQSSEA